MKQQGVHPDDAEGTSGVSSRPDTADAAPTPHEEGPKPQEAAAPQQHQEASPSSTKKRLPSRTEKRLPSRTETRSGKL
uniref:Uncharacterized protein n=1 Tax=Streptomyces avermitilis TaxID=33903 RepID=A0A499VMW4_STRAX|nr:hypothetical protein SAVMC3_35600 [Streptomyces avermitilis]